jgi:hypothetical protein
VIAEFMAGWCATTCSALLHLSVALNAGCVSVEVYCSLFHIVRKAQKDPDLYICLLGFRGN